MTELLCRLFIKDRKNVQDPAVRRAYGTLVSTVGIILNILLIPIYGITGLAFAGAMAAWSNCIMLYSMLHLRGHFHLEVSLLLRIGRITISAAGMAAVLVYGAPFGDGLYDGSIWERVGAITALVCAGGFVYAVLAWLTGAIDRDKIAMLTKKKAAEQAAQEGQ